MDAFEEATEDVYPACPICQGPMCDGQKYSLSKMPIGLGEVKMWAYCANSYFAHSECTECGDSIEENVAFLQCEKGPRCRSHDGESCNRSFCTMEACSKACMDTAKGCIFVQREGCPGELKRSIAVRFGLKPADSQLAWVWDDVVKAPPNTLTAFELTQLCTVFGLTDIETPLRVYEFTMKMQLDQSFEGIVELTDANAPKLVQADALYAVRRRKTLRQLELVQTYLNQLRKLRLYVQDNFGRTTDESGFDKITTEIDDALFPARMSGKSNGINVRLTHSTVRAAIHPDWQFANDMLPRFKNPEVCQRFNVWIQSPEINSPIYHQHQVLVDRLNSRLLEKFMADQKHIDARRAGGWSKDPMPPAKRQRHLSPRIWLAFFLFL